MMTDNQTSQEASTQPEIPSPTHEELAGTAQPLPEVDWKQYVPKDYAEEKLWEPFAGKPLSEVLKASAEAQKLIGKSIQLPADENDTEGWNRLYKHMGRPEKAEAYEYTPPESETVVWNKQTLAAFKKKAHEAGLSQKQAKAILDWQATDVINDSQNATREELAKEQEVARQVTEKYGQNGEYYTNLAHQAAKEYFGDELGDEMVELMKGNFDIFQGFSKLGQELGEAGTFGKVSPGDFGGIDANEAKLKIGEVNSEITDKTNSAYWNPKHPGHQQAVAETLAYFKAQGKAS